MQRIEVFIIVFIIVIIVAASIYCLTWYRFRAPDLSAFDIPIPELMGEPTDIGRECEYVALKNVARLNELGESLSKTNIAGAWHQLEELLFQKIDVIIVLINLEDIPLEWEMAEGASAKWRVMYLHGERF